MISVKVEGVEEVVRLMDQLPKRLHSKHFRIVLSAASSPILKALRSTASKESGLLQKAQKMKFKQSRDGAYTVMGTSTSVSGQVSLRTGGKYAGKMRTARRKRGATAAPEGSAKRWPVKYAHLVEKGRKAVSTKKRSLYSAAYGRFFGKSVRATTGTHFTEQAYRANIGNARSIIITKLRAAVSAESKN